MNDNLELQLDESFDWIIHQLTKGNTIQGLKNNKQHFEFEQVKEWKSKYGFQFQIYPNDHFIKNKPHFHLIKRSDGIDCRLFFNGKVIDCKGKSDLDKRTKEAIEYFLSISKNKSRIIELWNNKNPAFTVKTLNHNL